MQSTLLHHPASRAPEAAQLVATLVADAATQSGTVAGSSNSSEPRPLVHLARLGGNGSRADDGDSQFAIGFGPGPVEGHQWTEVGRLDLKATSVETVLLAALSAVAMQHVREAEVQIGDPVIVFGHDAWSLLLVQWAKLQGASPIAFVAQGTRPLTEHAAAIGVDEIIAEPSAANVSKAVKRTYRGAGFAVALDASATELSLTRALTAVRDGGRYVLAAIDPDRHVSLNAYPDLHRRDLEITTPMPSVEGPEFTRLFRFNLDLANRGRLRLDGVIDHTSGWRILNA